jgi:hypothetical protein
VLNKIPIIGWFFTIAATISLSIPFWFGWSVYGIGEIYFYYLPIVFQDPPFWGCFWFFMVIAILKGTLTPQIFTISNYQTNSQSDE